MKPTYLDIQKITGLSLSTISKYLNGGNVLPENKKAIDKAIKQLDYHINDYARGLQSKRSKSIGLLIPELESTFHTTIMSHIAHTLRKHGYACIVYTCDGNPENEADAIAFLLSKMVDGIIRIPIEKIGKHFYAARERGVPVVLVDRKTTDFRTDKCHN